MREYKFSFYKNRKILFMISLVIFAIGLVFNIIFGTKLDLQFTGGALIKYSYSGDIVDSDVKSLVEFTTAKAVDLRNDQTDSNEPKTILLSFSGTEAISLEKQQELTAALSEKYPDGNWELATACCIDPSMGQSFFFKCLICIILTFLLLTLYIAIRFKKIGGWSAGAMAIVALLHDIIMVYFTFIICKMPLNDNFIAVVLTILGYSLNDTIVIYDRIRENRRILGPKAELRDLVDRSINQSLGRTIHTSVSTFISIAVVFVMGMVYNLHTITSFSLPMMVGVVTGCYSSVCIAGPLYVMWCERKHKIEKDAPSAVEKVVESQS
ncbi:MAG: protein translocase subunit SecF [Oscillospiraceae bacterium]|jgi:preprotein translocase subunit SecF|nr:protein translocase subunit SecF [Oscillospiraceae bacterium]